LANRRQSGYRAKKSGQQLESYVESCFARQGFLVVRIPDGARRISQTKMIPQRAPFDFVAIHRDGACIFFDAKYRACKSIIPSMFTSKGSTSHQRRTLEAIERHKAPGSPIKAGFLVYLESTGRFYFVDSRAIKDCQARKQVDSVDLGGRELGFDAHKILAKV
jgi:hypothetical protein